MIKKTILVLVNHEIVIFNFRKEIVERLLDDGHRVIISSPGGEKIDKLVEMEAEHDEVEMNRHGKNPLEELKLLNYYDRIMKKYNPDIVFSYTIKPNIYGAISAKKRNIPFVANVTGLGISLQKSGLLQRILIQMYKRAFSKVQTVFFQNKSNQQLFIEHNVAVDKHKLLPGSGVNLDEFRILEYPREDKVRFVFISRIMKDKGIEEYLQAAEYIKNKYSYVEFHICGMLDGDYEEYLQKYIDKNIVTYHGMISDVKEILKSTHCTVHPSYHEGLSNVLLESAASGRPVLASDIPGCRETFEEGINGFGFASEDTNSLIEAIEKFLRLSHEEKKKMGLNGRNKVESEFDRQIVVDKYLEEIELAEHKAVTVEGK